MDAVILAGGKGSRLEGVVPAYWKPLTLLNGVPLVQRIYDQCSAQEAIENVFIVVAPENAHPISQIMHGRRPYMIVQPSPRGPGHALQLALELSRADTALVVMGDNLITDDDVERVCELGVENEFVIGTAQLPTAAEAARFTRIYSDGLIEEGPEVTDNTPLGRPTPKFTVWCGPLVLPVNDALRALCHGHDESGEHKIGTHLKYIKKKPMLVPCSALDIGTPETIMEVSQ